MGRAHEVRAASIAKSSARKAAINGRISKEIYLVAKRGGINPESNLPLRAVIEKARTYQVPQNVVQRALKRVVGKEDIQYISGRYEALGPGGSALLIDVLTTNVNRASATIREVLNKNGGNPEGKVAFLFHKAALLVFSKQGKFLISEDPLELLLSTDLDLTDVEERNGLIQVETKFEDLDLMRNKLEKLGVKEFVSCGISWVPNDPFLSLEEPERSNFFRLLDKLEELEDVQNIYHNVV